MEPEEARKRVTQTVRENERKALQEAKEKGWSFGGAKRARRQPITRQAQSWETFGSRNPKFAAAGDLEAALAAVARNKIFDAEYDEALKHWMHGDRRRAVFPHGTWKMRVVHNARCRPPPVARIIISGGPRACLNRGRARTSASVMRDPVPIGQCAACKRANNASLFI